MSQSPSDRERDLAKMRDLLSRPHVRFDDSEAGAAVVGVVVDVREVDGAHSRYTLLTIDADGDELVDVHCGRSVLANEVGSRDVRPGDLFGVRYQGEKVGRGGKTYHSYAVAHQAANDAPRVPTVHDDEQFSEEPF
jgi:homogentisate 1,2-dioxygenase